MLTRKLDSAFDAILACRLKAPALLDFYRPGTLERGAVEGLLTALENVDAALTRRAGGTAYAGAPAAEAS